MTRYLVGGLSALALCWSAACQALPQVDLGYEIHQAISYNVRTNLKHRRQAGADYCTECFRFIQLQQHKIRATPHRRITFCSTGPSYRTESHCPEWQLLANLPSITSGMVKYWKCLYGSLCSRQCIIIQLHSCSSIRASSSSNCCAISAKSCRNRRLPVP